MSQVLPNDRPWTESEKEYALARSGGDELVATNESQFPPGSDSDDAKPGDDEKIDLSQEVYDHVKGLSVEQTQAALREANLSIKGEESDLKVRLAEHLQKKQDTAGN